MRTQRIVLIGWAIALLGVTSQAQTFNSGSSGVLGNMVITTNTTWEIPDDGQFHVNSLIVNAPATLSFRKPLSGMNPPVYILARSNVTINGAITVDGQNSVQGQSSSEGGPGGFNGGGAGIPPASLPGSGQGPGRGLPGQGASYGTVGGGNVPTYGNLLLFPLVGGSGGGGGSGNPGRSGGGGGGAILIASDTAINLSGDVFARGGFGVQNIASVGAGAGSGGSVRLVSPKIAGTGRIWLGNGGPFGVVGERAGTGRARIDCLPQPIEITVIGNSGEPAAWRIGRNPAIFPPAGQRLEIIHAAGTDIPPGTNSAVFVTLPAGSSSNQIVTLRAVNFSGTFDVKVDITPENGASSRTNFAWNVGANVTATTNVPVRIPGNIPTRITAWAEVLF